MAAAKQAYEVAKGVYGLGQYIQGRKLAKSTIRPDYEIPQAMQDKMSAAERMAYEGLPAEQKKQYIDNLQRTTQFGLGQLGDRKAGITGLGALVQNEQDAYRELLVKDAEARIANQKYLGQVQSEIGGLEDKEWDINKFQPYKEKAAAARALQGQGIQNIFGAGKGLAEGIENDAAMAAKIALTGGLGGLGGGAGEGAGSTGGLMPQPTTSPTMQDVAVTYGGTQYNTPTVPDFGTAQMKGFTGTIDEWNRMSDQDKIQWQ